jgi:hypothetical protein
MSKLGIASWLRVLAVGLTLVAFTPAAVLAVSDPPKPEPKPKPKPKP